MPPRLWHYLAFGLRFVSDFAIDQLPPADPPAASGWEQAAVRVISGEIAKDDFTTRQNGNHIVMKPEFFYFAVKAVARYLVTGGNRIVVEAMADAPPDAINTFLLGSCCGALLFQRGLLPLHGSAVATTAGAVLILGESGAGKSTLAANLNRRGFPLLSDDVCAIDCANAPVLFPAYPQMKLTPESATALAMTSHDFSAYEEKFHLRHPKFCANPLPLAAICLLEIDETLANAASERQLRGAEKFARLRKNVYRDFYISEMKLDAQVFQQCAAISARCAVFQFSRPKHAPTFDALAELIVKRFAPPAAN
ncbi:MAG: hypothetical protein LBU39_02830 [Desulfobulbaceae bacterium]|jgi:hypothetical protein|nr:hypothetical protein [Desulfobulbaceae bacterium]